MSDPGSGSRQKQRREDLTKVVPAGSGQSTPAPLSFATKPFDPAPARENIRGQIAIYLVLVFIFLIVFVVAAAIGIAVGCGPNHKCSAEALELKSLRTVIELVLTPLVGLVGAVTGFYFGEKSGAANSESGGTKSNYRLLLSLNSGFRSRLTQALHNRNFQVLAFAPIVLSS